MKISEIFNLEKTQRELDFVDIDIQADYPLFLDPHFLSMRTDKWSTDATTTITSFFQHVLDLVTNGRQQQAKGLFMYLSEPGETCLGVSSGIPRGRGLGSTDATVIFDSIIQSGAIETGLLEDLQDSVIFVEGIGKDKLSDMVTNIIRGHLIEYTQEQCKLWEIPLTLNVPSGFFWDSKVNKWSNVHTDMLVVDNKKILLVPKAIVSYSKGYTPEQFHQHFVLNFLQNEHLHLNTALVTKRVLKDGTVTHHVYKKDLKEKVAPLTKEFLRDFTLKHPEVFAKFKSQTRHFTKPLDHEEFREIEDYFDTDDFIRYLIEKLKSIPTGTKNATDYHRHVVGVLDFVFYPNLVSPRVEHPIHDGRKRIDLTFDNAAESGFFHRVHDVLNIPSQFIFVECKNYSSDPQNPELDQLSGRFSVNRGKFGLLLCRDIIDMELFLKRCSDTYKDDRGLIIPLVDSDLIKILSDIGAGIVHPEDSLLFDRARDVMLR